MMATWRRVLQNGIGGLALVAGALVINGHVAAAGAPTSPRPGADTACVAIVLPSLSGIGGDATTMAKSLRELMVSYLTGPTIKSKSLEARLPEQAVEEAKGQSCSNILISSFTLKRGGSGVWGKVVSSAAETAAWTVPYGGTVASAAATTAAVTGAYAVGSIASNTHAKDELSIEYRLGTVDTVLKATPKKDTLKAKNDGEDLATPLVERTASAILKAVSK